MGSIYDVPELTIEQFNAFAKIILQRARITLKENKLTLLSNRLRKRLQALGLANFGEYLDYMNSAQAAKELVPFLEVITTNETYFWRTIQNFQMLKENLLPLLLKNDSSRDLRFWSAGCSTGEEPYNLAIELSESMARLGIFEYSIEASDISRRVVEIAREGIYSGRSIEKIPDLMRQRYFQELKDQLGYLQIREDIRNRVSFEVSNLFAFKEWRKHCIFCRNVMIYFSRKNQEDLVRRFYQILEPGGFLIIGHSESLHMMDSGFESLQFKGGVAYRRPL